jgi:enamine deaminase RidA (YjgF/YER057c/UK114 family)
MNIQRINPGKRLSDATVYNGVAYLAGQVPEDARLPIREQTRSVLAQIDASSARPSTSAAWATSRR